MMISELGRNSHSELCSYAQSLGIESASFDREHIIREVFKKQAQQVPIICEGVLEVLSDKFGFLRYHQANYLPGVADVYVHPSHINKYRLQTGDLLEGVLVPPTGSEYDFL